ncbi:MAG: CBS domain-containing protein [Bacteroidia bacterium]
MKVHNILSQKGTVVYSVNASSTVYDALKIMADKNLGALVVTEGKKISGIFTERDYARKVVLKGKFSKETSIADIMHPDPVTVTEDASIGECMTLMTNNFIRHLPVVRNGELAGMISIGDVVKFIIREQQFIIENLDNYISGSSGGIDNK